MPTRVVTVQMPWAHAGSDCDAVEGGVDKGWSVLVAQASFCRSRAGAYHLVAADALCA